MDGVTNCSLFVFPLIHYFIHTNVVWHFQIIFFSLSFFPLFPRHLILQHLHKSFLGLKNKMLPL